jgi:DNA polymerase-4
MEKILSHIDVKGCYANLAVQNYPYLQGKCVAVGGDPESRHGIILASNQAAKKFGVKTGSALWQARSLCPQLEIVPIHILGRKTIRRMSDHLKELCYSVTPQLQMEGDDGIYMDWTGCVKSFEEAEYKAHELRLRFYHDTGLTTSVGVSFTRNFAKLGSDYEKPFGTTIIDHDNWRKIVWPLPVSDLYWVGPATTAKLQWMGIHTIGQLAACNLDRAYDRFGVVGRMLWLFANGQDVTQIAYKDDRQEEKTVGNSTTALADLHTLDDILSYTTKLCNIVSESLRTSKYFCNGVKIGLRSAETLGWIGRQKKLPFPSRTSKMLFDQANMLIQRNWDGNPLRGVDVRAYSLIDDDYLQMALLPEMLADQKQERLDTAVQEIHRRMGPKMLMSCRVFSDSGLRTMDLSSAESAQRNAFRRF